MFHALEQIVDVAKVLHTEPAAVTDWNEAARQRLREHGRSGIETCVRIGAENRTLSQQEAVEGLLTNLSPHQHHLNYAGRLAAGQSIGSDQVERACKNLIGRRLKQTGARRRVRRVNRMAGVCSLMYSDQWQTYWQTA